jgi:Flp pilus assembly protein TadG
LIEARVRFKVPLRRRATDGTRGTRPRRTDRGASTLELALLTPVLLFVILFVVQFAMVYHARHVALAAAQSAARVARAQRTGDWQAAARAEAFSYVDKIGPQLLTTVRADMGEDQNNRWVTVRGNAVQVVPFVPLHVSERSGGPVECFRPDVGTSTCEGP